MWRLVLALAVSCGGADLVVRAGLGDHVLAAHGSAIRVHALLYRQQLVVHVFNAGRTADTIEDAVLGELRSSQTGASLSSELGLPLRLEPGQAKKWVLDSGVLPPERLAMARGGWDSLRLLLGTMRQRRAEDVPVVQDARDGVGWRFVPRRVKATRYLPLVAATLCFDVAAAPEIAGPALGVLGVWVAVNAYVAAVGRSGSHRRRVERRVFAAGFIDACLQAAFAASGRASEPPPGWTAWLLLGYTVAGRHAAAPARARKHASDRR